MYTRNISGIRIGVVEIFVILPCCKSKVSLLLNFPYTTSASSAEIVSKKIEKENKIVSCIWFLEDRTCTLSRNIYDKLTHATKQRRKSKISVTSYCCSRHFCILDVHGSVHHNTILIEINNKMQLCRTIYYSTVP